MRLKTVLTNWKTTALGVIAIVVAVGSFLLAILDGDPSTKADIELLLSQIVAIALGMGLVVGRDGDKTSEESSAE